MEKRQDDLISRQAAIDGKITIQRTDGVEIYYDEAVTVEYLKALPSVQPEPIKITIDHALTSDELERLKQSMRNTPIMLLPSAHPHTDEELQKMQDMEQAQLDKAFELGREDAKAEIVRCEDCKFYRKHGYVNGKPTFVPRCTFSSICSIYVNADDFCSKAERRTDD